MNVLNILIIESNVGHASQLATMVKLIGYSVETHTMETSKNLNLGEDYAFDLVIIYVEGIDEFSLKQIIGKIETQKINILLIANQAELEKWQNWTSISTLAKPIKKGMLRSAIGLAIQNKSMTLPSSHSFSTEQSFFLKSKGVYYKLLIKDILFVKSANNHVVIYTQEGTFIHQIRLSDIQEFVKNHHFLQIHRSYLVNLKKATAIDIKKNELYINEISLPISRRMKPSVMETIKRIW